MEDIRENGRILTTATQYVSEKAVKGKLFPADSIIIATSATIGEHALIKVPSLANQRFTYLTLKDEFKDCVDMMFVFYYCFRLDEYCKSHLNQGNFASVDMKQFAASKFPVPPLPVQREIVRILDNFTELTAELTARKQQYAYYRNKLLKKNTKAIKMEFGDMFNFQNGFAFKSRLFKKSGNAILRIANIKENQISTDNLAFFDEADYKEDLSQYIVRQSDIVIAMSGATTGKIGVNVTPFNFYLNQRVGKFIPKENIILNRYLYHLLLQMSGEIYAISEGGAQPNLSSEKLKKLTAYIPPISEQKRIVKVLDRFDTLCTDLSSGLPAEIEARQKQYEYYRDKLLSFEEKI